ncbi:Oligo-1,6-glucosidase [Roseivivax jejudonensis]|uniref:Oligo-1,6-glucosidase n=1 Tax=Roseivivax jejudonensis TaxID=1529041 RepID=A0A1X6ZZF8_9RHOB|nr:alpha-amylase family glycosyl hydrolase [Roseivivax jejudonensis]SLN65751.1 Oligo-1,6-glucosidase [Roseivivax jejudonensis]
MTTRHPATRGAGREALIAEAMLIPSRPADAERDWWRGGIFYEVYVRSFQDSDGDGVGDLRGVIDRLDYIRSLGVDGVWLSPFYPSPGEDFGYDISDFRNVDPQLGSLGDVMELIEACHDRDLKLLLDFIPCHTSEEHHWFVESRRARTGPRADWYIWADAAEDGGPPNNWLSSFGGGSAWTWEPRRQQYYYHPFLQCQPALNLRNPEVLEAVIDALRFWLDLGVDGFRLDAVQCLCWDDKLRNNPPRYDGDDQVRLGGGPSNPFARQQHLFDRDLPDAIPIIERLREAVDAYSPSRALIGELADLDSSRFAVKYTADGNRLHAVYDFDLINTDQTLEEWMHQLDIRSDFIGSGWLMNNFTNHDSIRAVSNLTSFAVDAGRTGEAAKLLLFLQATLRGGGIVFQGEELGLPQPELPYEALRDPWSINLWPDFVGRDGVRTPMPWDAQAAQAGFSTGAPWMPVPQEHLPFAVSRQEDDPDSVLSFFRALMAWRREVPLLRMGSERAGSRAAVPLVVFDRYDADRTLTVILNFSLAERWFAADPPATLLEDVPGSLAEMGEQGVRLPGLGFAVLDRGPPG